MKKDAGSVKFLVPKKFGAKGLGGSWFGTVGWLPEIRGRRRPWAMQLLLSALLGPPYQRNAIPAVWGNNAGGRATGGTLGNAVARAASCQARRSPGLRLCNL